jgi:NAD-dependent deacetylase
MMVSATDLGKAAALFGGAQRVAVLTGAGVSKESGVPTFRDPIDGLWAKYDPQQLASPAGFRRDPDLVWSWYMYRLDLVSAAYPNPGHRAIVDLQGLFEQVTVLTQNVDGLHHEAGSRDVVELHGSIRRYKCFGNCQGNPTPIALESIAYDKDSAPACPHCGERVRPDVVWYGERLPPEVIGQAVETAARCDVMLVAGTSGVVEPAASLPYIAKANGGRVVEVNVARGGITPIADVFLEGPSGEVLPRLVETLQA